MIKDLIEAEDKRLLDIVQSLDAEVQQEEIQQELMTYSFQQYEKFFDNFEGTNAGLIYKPRTFCSTRLYALVQAILQNIENEDKIKEAILSDTKLGKPVFQLMYGDINRLEKIVKCECMTPDFIDAIKLWRQSL
jgi:hypothetical protein